MIFGSLILLRSSCYCWHLNTLLGIRCQSVNASKKLFVVMELQPHSSLDLKYPSTFLTFCCCPWKNLPSLAMVLACVGLCLWWGGPFPGGFGGCLLNPSRTLVCMTTILQRNPASASCLFGDFVPICWIQSPPSHSTPPTSEYIHT